MMSHMATDEFDRWAKTFHDHYDEGSRLEHEFRLTRTLVIAARKWTRYIDEKIKDETGYSRSHWQALAAVSFSGEPVATLELSDRLGVRWPTLIRTLNEMEAAGLIERTQDRDDRRLRMITISPAGRKLLRDVRKILDPLRSVVLDHMSTDEIVIAEQLLTRLLGALPS